MIYTVTFNPSLDYIVTLDSLTLGAVNRTREETIFCGGKGVNVSIVLKNLGHESKALGFVAGFTGHEIESRLTQMGCKSDFIALDAGLSRINVKIRAEKESEINGQGPCIDEKALAKLFQKLETLRAGDILVLAGSIPNTLPNDIYEKIMKSVDGKDIRIAVDATSALLLNVLKYKPFLIKPNHHELAEMFHTVLETDADILKYAAKLQEMGARNVLISMAGDGAILLAENGASYKSPVPKGKLVNSVGAGDSMVAGFLAGFLETGDFQRSFKMGVATGSASAFSASLATRPEVEALLKTL